MKKILLGLSAFTMLFATSCQKDVAFDTNVEESAVVSFNIDTPDLATRAYSDGTTATVLQYAVYDAAGNELTDLTVTNGEIHGSTTVKLQLTTGNKYSVIFWAAAPNAPYSVNFAEKTMSVDYSKAVSNDEARDAFYKYHTFTVTGAQTETIELRRPFAQLNIGTADYAASTSAGYTPTKSAVTIKNVYSTLNLATGAVDGSDEATFNFADIKKDETFPVAGYEYMAMNYLLVPTDKEVVDIEFTYTDANNDAKTRTVGSVPVQRNYRTNIYGNLLTSYVDINVEIKPDYNEPAHELDALHKAALNGGEVTLTEDVTLTVPLEVVADMIINLDGYTITGPNEARDADGNRIHVIVNNGKLTINGGTINSIAENGGSAILNKGILTLNDVIVNGAPSNTDTGTASYAVNTEGKGSKLTVNNSTINGRGAIGATDGTKVEINGGTYHTPAVAWGHAVYASNEGTEVVINSGTFSEGYKMTANNWGMYQIYSGDKAKVIVNGGDFKPWDCANGYDLCTASEGTIKIYGGTFADDPSNQNKKNYVAEGYEAVKNGDVYCVVQSIAVGGAEAFINAVNNVTEGAIITLNENVTFTTENRSHNSGSWYDGIYYVGDKSFTIDLGGMTIDNANGAVNDYLLNFKNDGDKPCTITIKNGTIDAGTAAFCAICTSATSTQKITINLEDVNIINNISNGSTIKVRGGAELNVKSGAKITGQNSYLGIECVASTVNIYDGAEIYMNGTSSYNGCLVGACGNGVVNVYGGYGKGVRGGFIAMTSGGTINVAGGEWIANTDGTIGNNSNLYVLTAQNNKGESGYCGASIINVTGGTLRGGMDAWILTDANVEKAELHISGGNFNANPTNYLVDGYGAAENNGIYTVVPTTLKDGAVLDLGGVEYNETITVEGNVTIKGDTKIKTIKSTTGCTITIEDGKTLELTNFSFGAKDNAEAEYVIKGGTVTASYGFFQHGKYALYSNFETGYMYYSYGSDITVYGTFHSQGKGDGLDYVRGKLTIAKGGKSIHDKSLWVGQPASWGAMNASLVIEEGGYVQANSLSVYEGSTLTYSNDADLKYNTVTGTEYITKK